MGIVMVIVEFVVVRLFIMIGFSLGGNYLPDDHHHGLLNHFLSPQRL